MREALAWPLAPCRYEKLNFCSELKYLDITYPPSWLRLLIVQLIVHLIHDQQHRTLWHTQW